MGRNQLIIGQQLDRVYNISYFNYSGCCYTSSPCLYYLQASRDPLSPEAMNEIFEDVKDMGVLIGKGGIYGQVTTLLSLFITKSPCGINTAETHITKLVLLKKKTQVK